MPPEPLSDEERIQLFVAPQRVLLTDRVDALARIYAGVMASGNGYQDDRLAFARRAVVDFLLMIDGQP